MTIGCSRPIQVHLIAPPLLAWGLQRLVQSAQPHFELVGLATSAAESLPLLERCTPDVVVLDLDGAEPKTALAQLQAQTPAKIVLLTSATDANTLDQAVLAGARGVVKKHEPAEILLKAIEKVHEGQLWIERDATSRIFMEMARRKAAERNDPEKTKIASLTLRERQTIVAVASDTAAPAKVIAGRLCISEHTLRNHLTSIYGKLGLSGRLDLYAYATKHSLNKVQ